MRHWLGQGPDRTDNDVHPNEGSRVIPTDWEVFLRPDDGAPLFDARDSQAELLVRIYNREGAVAWPVPADLREKLSLEIRP